MIFIFSNFGVGTEYIQMDKDLYEARQYISVLHILNIKCPRYYPGGSCCTVVSEAVRAYVSIGGRSSAQNSPWLKF